MDFFETGIHYSSGLRNWPLMSSVGGGHTIRCSTLSQFKHFNSSINAFLLCMNVYNVFSVSLDLKNLEKLLFCKEKIISLSQNIYFFLRNIPKINYS